MKLFLTLVLFFLSVDFIYAQNDKVINRFIQEEREKVDKNTEFLPDSPNVLSWTGLLLIKLYQTFISSQDRPACVFQPSCSRYTAEAIKKYGLFRGIIMGAERLERCHPQAYGNYPLDEKTQKNLDPVP